MLKVGLTGGMGSGKTIVAQYFHALGYPVYDTDWHAKYLMQHDNSLHEQLIAAFGIAVFVDNKLNKKYLASLAFNSPEKLAMLNQLVHPCVKADFLRWVGSQSSPLMFLESAILFESNFSSIVDHTIVVTAPEPLRMARVMLRDGMTKEAINERLKYQWTENEKIMMADYVIINDDQHSIIDQCNGILSKLTES